MKSSNIKKSGSALLLTLLVVSLLLVIVLSFTVYVRLQLREATNRIELMQARHNAKLGMHLALAHLQKAAGPDQRVTARAEILGTAVTGSNKYWTGVWTNNSSGGVNANPVWLVSGISPDPVSGAGADGLEIFPAVNSVPAIKVPLEGINDPSGKKIGEIAYWVSDEGVKASVGARRQAVDIFNGTSAAHKAERRTIEYQADFGIDLASIFSTPVVDLTDSQLPELIDRVGSVNDFLLPKDASNDPIFQSLEAEFPQHDITTIAYGVLENSKDGGLKQNLSDLSPSNIATDAYSSLETYEDSFLNTDETRKFLNPEKANTLSIEYGDPAVAGIQEGDPFFSPRPILTEAVLYIGLFFNPGDKEIKTRFHIGAEFLNPYSLPLLLDPGQYGELTILFEGLPTLTVTDGSGMKPTKIKDMDVAQNRNIAKDIGYFTSVRVSPHASTGNSRALLPGELYKTLGPFNKADGLSRTIGTSWTTPYPPDNTVISIKSTHSNEPLIIKVVDPRYDAQTNKNVPVVQEIILERADVAFSDLDYEETFSDFNINKSSGDYTLEEDYTFAYHFRLWSDEADKGSMKELMSKIPILDPFIESSYEFVDEMGDTRRLGEYIIPAELDPRLIYQNASDLFSQLDLFRDELETVKGLTGTYPVEGHNGGNQVVYLVDVPTEKVLSVGQLTSLPIYRKPSHFIGSAEGGTFNEAFDKYYFSPKEYNSDLLKNILLSPALIHAGTLVSSSDTISDYADINDAEFELVSGQFNINSTSEKAWEAVLAAPILTPNALDEAAGPDITRTGAFSRFPQLQSALNDYYLTLAEIGKAENAFAQGIRVLEGDNGRKQIQEMAKYVVEQLKIKSEPFPDMNSFVNSGILQDAIAAATDSNGDSVNEDLFEYSNVYLRQNDLLLKIAPYSSTRSDTFKIRAYGNHLNPGTGAVRSRAACEVVVQRLPQKVDGSDPMLAAGFLDMRKFQIMSFKWLNNEDL